MPKKSRPPVVRTPTKHQLTRWQRERRLQRIIIAVVSVIVALVILIPAYGYYKEVIAKGQEVIAAVNGKPLTMDQYVRLLSFRQYQMDLGLNYLKGQQGGDQIVQQLTMQRASLPTQIVFDWADGEVIELAAPKLGISVTSDEVWQEVKKQLLGDPQADQQVDEAKRDSDAQAQLKSLTDSTGITADEFKHTVEVSLLRDKIDKQLGDQVVTKTLQLHVLSIQTDNQDDAQKAYDRVQSGEDFGKVAQEVSIDPLSKDKGGDLGWVPKGLQSAEFDQAVFALNPGQTSEPFKTSEGYQIVKVLERDDARDMDDLTLQQVKANVFTRWLDEEKKNYKIDFNITSDRQIWAQQKIAKDQANKAKKAQQQQQQPAG